MKRGLLCSLIFFFTISLAHAADSPASPNSNESRAAMQKVLDDYIGLYAKGTLEQWKGLFHPSAMVYFPAEDGTVNARNVEQFYERQRNFFTEKKSVSEKLENVQVLEGRKIARVTADYIFSADGVPKRGKLGLHLVETNSGWKIVSLVFSYDVP